MLPTTVLATALLTVAGAQTLPPDLPDWPGIEGIVPAKDTKQSGRTFVGRFQCTRSSTSNSITLPTLNSYTIILARGRRLGNCLFTVTSPANSNQTVTCYYSLSRTASFIFYDGSQVFRRGCSKRSRSCFKKSEWNVQTSLSKLVLLTQRRYGWNFLYCQVIATASSGEQTTTTPSTTTSTTTTSTSTSTTTTTTPSTLNDCECGKQVGTRIVGGQEADDNEFPFAARLSIVRSGGSFLCGGTVISNQFIVTAAHCTVDQISITALLGANSRSHAEGQTVDILQVIDHPDYNNETNEYDISLLRISPINFTANPRIRPACLPSGSDSYAGTNAVAIGWGRLEEGGSVLPANLMEVTVPVVSNTDCAAVYGTITDNMLCAGSDGKDSCQGDSGGPLLNQTSGNFYEVIGVTSFGNGCARPNFPGVYVRITNLLPWINEQTIQSSTCARPA